MDEIGEFLGWVTVACYLASICTFIVKRGYQLFIADLSRESAVKKYYLLLMKYIVKFHMCFGPGAGIFAVIHYFVQTSSGETSLTGTVLTVSMVITVILGAATKLIRGAGRLKFLMVHRLAVAFVLVMVILHLLFH